MNMGKKFKLTSNICQRREIMGSNPERRKDESDHQDELSDAVGDGGGCAEAWEATQDLRDQTRRTFLAGTVASLYAGTSLTNVAAAEDVPNDPDKQTSELSHSAKQELLDEAQSDDVFRAIWKKLSSQGLEPERESLVGYQTSYEEREWKFIRVPFSVRGNDTLTLDEDGDTYETGGIIYNTAEEVDPHGYVTTREVDYGAEPQKVNEELREADVDIDSIDTVPVVITHTNYSADSVPTRTRGRDQSGERQARSSSVSPQSMDGESDSLAFPVARGGQVSTQGCECNSALANPLTACAPCGIPDGDCIGDLANVYAVEIVACGTCVGSSGWATPMCATCLATIIEEDEFGFFCCPCQACDSFIVC